MPAMRGEHILTRRQGISDAEPLLHLLAIELDDQALFHRSGDVVARRKVANASLHRGGFELEPLRNLAALDALESSHDAGGAAALLANLDHVALADEVRRNV